MNELNDVNQNECIIKTPAFTLEEVKTAVQSLKNNKNPDKDLITSEMCRAMGKYGTGRLYNLVNNIWMSESIPTDKKRRYGQGTLEMWFE